MTIPAKKMPMLPVPNADDSPHADPHIPDAALPSSGSWEVPSTSGVPGNTWSLDAGAKAYEKFYAIDPQIPDNKFPRESGSDSYTGIPGDGKVPG